MFRNLTTVVFPGHVFLGNWLLQGRVQRKLPGLPAISKCTCREPQKNRMSTRPESRQRRIPRRISNGAYVVSYADMPIPGNEPPAKVRWWLDGSRDGQLGNMGGKLVSELRIQLGGKYPGRDIRADIPGKQMYAHTQIFIVDKRLYQIMAIGVRVLGKLGGNEQIFRLLCFTCKVASMSESLLPHASSFVSRPVPLPRSALEAKGAGLDEKYRLPPWPSWKTSPAMAEVSAAWSEAGLVFAVSVGGKKQPVWCRPRVRRTATACKSGSTPATCRMYTVPAASATALSFCPVAAAASSTRPSASRCRSTVPANRPGRSPPGLAGPQPIRPDGYRLECFVPAEAMIGFEPAEHPRMGFTYAVIDRELGEQTFSVGRPMPYDEDPSLWATLELVRLCECTNSTANPFFLCITLRL